MLTQASWQASFGQKEVGVAGVLLASLGILWTAEVVVLLIAYALRRERREGPSSA